MPRHASSTLPSPTAGDVLRRTLAALGMSQAELARRSGLTTKHVNQVIKHDAAIGVEAAIAIGTATGIPAEVWLVLDAMHRVQQITDRTDTEN